MRCQFGHFYDGKKIRNTKTAPYDQSAAKDAPDGNENLEMAHTVTGLRPERGYSATKYDGNAANPKKTVRRQFGRIYDEKKVRINLFGNSEQTNHGVT
ncbi:MAG: hypothetical protein WCS99_13420 [Limisphaerales bacterium]